MASVNPLTDKMREKVSKAEDEAVDVLETAQDTLVDFLDEAKQWAKKNPVAAVAAGFGAGVVLGSLLFRRD